jgi:hypothetical protein
VAQPSSIFTRFPALTTAGWPSHPRTFKEQWIDNTAAGPQARNFPKLIIFFWAVSTTAAVNLRYWDGHSVGITLSPRQFGSLSWQQPGANASKILLPNLFSRHVRLLFSKMTLPTLKDSNVGRVIFSVLINRATGLGQGRRAAE